MSTISKAVKINASVSKVFSVVINPENWTRYVTSLTNVGDLSPDAPAKGSTFSWEYKMMGVKFRGKGTVTENVRNKSFGLTMEGKFPVKEHYDFMDSSDGSTELKIKIEYEMPGELLKIIANIPLVEKLNALESKNVLEKIKLMCEA
jgi:uncharacterized membrane protein